MKRELIRWIVLIVFVISIVVIFAKIATAHDAEECDAITQQLQEWVEEADVAITPPLLEELETYILEWREACRPHKARSSNSSNSGPTPYRGMGDGNIEQWRDLVTTYFAPQDVETALCLISYESGGNPDAKNPRSSASGLFQHLGKYWSERSVSAGWAGASIFDPEANVAVAAWLKGWGGWQHWTPWLGGKCRGL